MRVDSRLRGDDELGKAMQNDNTITPLKEALISTVRALARDKNLPVRFSDIPTNADEITLPALTELPSPEALSTIRGEGDYAAFSPRLHNAETHAKLRPATPASAQLFDILESVRIESLGSQHMPGVQHNLYRRYEQRAMQQGLHGPHLPLPALVELYARRHVQLLPIPAFLSAALDKNDEVTAIVPQLQQLQQHLDQQGVFADLSLKLIETLAQLAFSQEPGKEGGEHSTTESSSSSEPQDNADSESLPTPGSMADGGEQSLAQSLIKPGGPGSDEPPPDKTEEARLRDAPPHPQGHNEIAFTAQPYQAYSQQHDEIISAHMLASTAELELLSRQLDQKLSQFQSITSRLAARLQRLLLARQARHWMYEQEEGQIDSRKLARVIIHPNYELLYKREKDTEFRDTVVSLLIDNSGSMRGRPITIAALSADILSRTLERCGVKVEILGFTTRDWKGGQSHKDWVKAGRPAHPGRLNDLRHIIYKSADVSWRKAHKNLGLMLKDGILKENIDGEAILWACDRLRARPEQRRILMVISDGAPVDDSTLSVNSSRYLDTHLRDVIARVEQQGLVELVAIGIGHDVTRYYKRAVTISEIDKLGETMTQQLAELFAEKPKRKTIK